MKKTLAFLMFASIIFFNSCSVQDKMNPLIFIEKFSEISGDSIKNDTPIFTDDKCVFFFTDENDKEYVCELLTDKAKNVKKICLASDNTNKAELFIHFSEIIIKIFSPDDESSLILSKLFKNKWDYTDSQWYSYSSVVSDKGMFFCIESKKLTTESDAELTLKQNDIIYH